jgi:hypothetical protein
MTWRDPLGLDQGECEVLPDPDPMQAGFSQLVLSVNVPNAR